MRRHYVINSKTCHFHEYSHGVFHEVKDLLNLINFPASVKKQFIDNWHDKLALLPAHETGIAQKLPSQHLVISEKLLPALLRDAQAQHPERTLIDVKKLLSRILQERLDAIVKNDIVHQTHAESGARSVMLNASRATYLTAYDYMNWYEQQGVLSPVGVSEWHRIKALLPTKAQGINERHLYALLALTAQIWPEGGTPKSENMTERKAHLSICVLIEILKSDRMSNTEKPRFILEAIRQIGQAHENKSKVNRDQPEP